VSIHRDSDLNYTGQPTNPTFGTHEFHSRTLDPTTGTWAGLDKWRGLLSAPQTLNRYTYVTNNPATLIDNLGYDPVRVIGGTSYDYLPASQSWEPIPATTPAFFPAPPLPPYSIHRPAYTPPTTNSYFNRFIQQVSFSTPARVSAPQISARHTALDCVGDMKVGTSPRQLAINEARGKALAEANLQTKPQWVQDLNHANQAFAEKARPLIMLGFAGLGGTATKAELTYTLETKAAGQMSGRGWSNDLISNAINQPTRTVITRDTRWDPAINARRDDPATAYYATDGSYVVRNDVNGTVVQVSDKFKPTWKAPWEK